MAYEKIIATYNEVYQKTFAEHGATPEGVFWGAEPADLRLRLDMLIRVLEVGMPEGRPPRILDVGCGYGSLLDRLEERGIPTVFTGIDLCSGMLEAARLRHPEAEWVEGDIFEYNPPEPFDFVVCNGLTNLRQEHSLFIIREMARSMLRKMFSLCRSGCGFNFLTTHANYHAGHLCYQNPAEMLAWSMCELTSKARIDHAYSLFEFALYLYRSDLPELAHGAHRSPSSPPQTR